MAYWTPWYPKNCSESTPKVPLRGELPSRVLVPACIQLVPF